MASSEENIDFKKLLNCKQSSVANPARVGGFSGMDAPSKALRFYFIPALKKCSFEQPPLPPNTARGKLQPVTNKFDPPEKF